MTLHLTADGPRPWHRTGAVRARGVGFAPDGTCLEGPALAAWLDGPAETFVERITALDGTFAAVHSGEDTIAAVDRIRSTPLFYGRDAEGAWHLSDDARRIAEATDARLDDAVAAAEFMLQSATTGATTLSTSVRQVQAGEAVTFDGAEPTGTRYYRYGDASVETDASEEELVEEGARLLERAFERFLISVQGRPVVVPLSGGLDSRLIAAMLVRGGRADAQCFSYGRERSFEARASRRVAEALGLRWIFVPYTNRDWHRWFMSPSFQQFRREASGLTAIEHEQDWPAVLRLREQGLAEDAVFVPGHAGDFLGGSHLPAAPAAFERDPVNWLWRKYYTEWPTTALDPDLEARLRARIAACLPDVEPVEAFTHFGWQERQAKMIANSVRVYEHHGFDWRLPFWTDTGVLDFWGRVPISLRRGRQLYRRVVRRLIGDARYDLPSTLRRESPVTGKLRRLTDRDAGRYGIWLGPRPVAAALRTRVGDLVADHALAHPVVGPVVEALVRPIAHRPVPWATINGLLALSELNDLSREGGL